MAPLEIADPKTVSPGYLNRARCFVPEDIGANKAVA
ncbi:ThiF family adenylyltransferase [Hyphomicrobium sp. 99]|nr:ThiF family adenylyltransferase [Hyphomicrobium sp. 99]